MKHSRTLREIIGVSVIFISLPLYLPTVASFLLVTLGGWTTDNLESQTLIEHVWIRLLNGLLLLFNILLTYAGIQIVRRKINGFTYVALLLGLLPVLPIIIYLPYFFGRWSWSQ